jgi:site-specific recombinase XerD
MLHNGDMMMLSAAIDDYLAALAVGGRAPATIAWYRAVLHRLVAVLGDEPIGSIRAAHLASALDSIRKGNTYANSHRPPGPAPSAATIAGHLRAWRGLWKWAARRGLVAHNPLAEMPAPRQPRRIPRRMSAADLAAMRQAATAPRDALILALLADTGARAGGVAALRWADRVGDSIVLVEKGGQSRLAWPTPATWALMDAWRAECPSSVWVFPGRTGPGHMRVDSIWHIVRRIAEQAGVDERACNPHSIRHAFAADYLMHGGDLQSLSQLLGHSTVTITGDIYGMLDTEQLREKHHRHSMLGRDTI